MAAIPLGCTNLPDSVSCLSTCLPCFQGGACSTSWNNCEFDCMTGSCIPHAIEIPADCATGWSSQACQIACAQCMVPTSNELMRNVLTVCDEAGGGAVCMTGMMGRVGTNATIDLKGLNPAGLPIVSAGVVVRVTSSSSAVGRSATTSTASTMDATTSSPAPASSSAAASVSTRSIAPTAASAQAITTTVATPSIKSGTVEFAVGVVGTLLVLLML
ncbi:hypothetical protein BC830DRAFT_1144565 [Chytriomyces sp. MP71]|nr:hypothetical protein BC830DRAFT_1144565 [Chytriomyces sp. MP71]